MIVQNTPFKNYNTNNPFIVMCRETYDEVTNKSIQLVKMMLYGAIASVILGVSHIVLIVRSVKLNSMTNPWDIITLGCAGMTLLAIYLILAAIAFDKVIIARNKSKTLNTLLKPSLEDMVAMNNESVLNVLLELQMYSGRADMFMDIIKIYNMSVVVYSIAVIFIATFMI